MPQYASPTVCQSLLKHQLIEGHSAEHQYGPACLLLRVYKEQLTFVHTNFFHAQVTFSPIVAIFWVSSSATFRPVQDNYALKPSRSPASMPAWPTRCPLKLFIAGNKSGLDSAQLAPSTPSTAIATRPLMPPAGFLAAAKPGANCQHAHIAICFIQRLFTIHHHAPDCSQFLPLLL